MSCCSKITDILKAVLKAIGPILTIALLVFATYMIIFDGPLFMAALQGFAGILPSAALGLAPATYGYLALGAAVIIDAATGGEMIGSVVTGVSKVVGKVIAGVAGGVATGIFGEGGFTKVLAYAGLGFLLYLFITRDKTEPPPTPEVAPTANVPQLAG